MKNDYMRFIKSISLETIQPMEIIASRRGDFKDDKESVEIKFNLAYPGDSGLDITQKLLLRPIFEVFFSQDKTDFYYHKVTFVVVINITNKTVFEETWNENDVKQRFMEHQIKKTLWPILRQQVLDGMSRLGLPSIPLPWLV